MKRRTLLTAGLGTGTLLAASQPGAAAIKRMFQNDETRRSELYSLLGRLPSRNRKVSAQLVSSEDRGTYTLEKLVLDLNGEEAAPAYFARPKHASGRLPTVLFNHSHGGGYQIEVIAKVGDENVSLTTSVAAHVSSVALDPTTGSLMLDTDSLGEIEMGDVERVL